MQQQPIPMNNNTTSFTPNLAAAYGGGGATVDAIQLAQKRSASDAGLSQQLGSAAKKQNTIKVVLEDDVAENSTAAEQTTGSGAGGATSTPAKLQAVQEASESVIDTKFDWQKLTSAEKIGQVMQISDSLSKNGDYLNINPLSSVYSSIHNQIVECGLHFQFQTPLMVCTTGLRNSERFPGQWSALLGGSEVPQSLLQRLNQDLPLDALIKPQVADHMAFLRSLQQYLNSHLVEHGEQIFLNTAKRADEENAKILAKNPQAKVSNPYKQVSFVTRGKQDPTFGQLYKTGAYTQHQYAAEVGPLIGSFFVAYEDNEPSVQIRAYPKKVNGVRNNYVPDVVILNEFGQIEQFDPSAPYCIGGRTSWEALLKVSIKWYDGQFRFHLNMRSFRYYLNGGANNGNMGGSNSIIFTDANGNKTRVTQQ